MPLVEGVDFFNELERAILREKFIEKPKMMILGFPSNPTAQCVELEFFEKAWWRWRNATRLMLVVRDWLCRYRLRWLNCPSVNMRVPSCAMWQSSSLRCRFNMAGWRIGFMVGNKRWSSALARIKTMRLRAPLRRLQVAAIAALEGDQQCVRDDTGLRANAAVMYWLKGCMKRAGWLKCRRLRCMSGRPEPYAAMGSLEFAKARPTKRRFVSPGIGFGDYGDTHVRFALIENRDRIRQAIKRLKAMFRADGLLPANA